MTPVIVLRPEPGNRRTAARAQALGLTVRCFPLFEAMPLVWDAPEAAAFDALLLTSAQAVRLGGPSLRRYFNLSAYAVGKETAAAMDQVGFACTVSGTGDGSAIAARIAADGHRSILHLAGDMVAPIEAGPLRITRVPVYAMAATAVEGLTASLAPGAVLLIHSPRAGAQLAAIVPFDARATLHLVAISTAALAASGDGWASKDAPTSPDDDAMLALALALCKTSTGYGRDTPDP